MCEPMCKVPAASRRCGSQCQTAMYSAAKPEVPAADVGARMAPVVPAHRCAGILSRCGGRVILEFSPNRWPVPAPAEASGSLAGESSVEEASGSGRGVM